MKMQDENVRIRRLIDLDKSILPPDGGPEYNRLIFTSSPYLLQHAANPVDWYPWGEEAFAKASAEDKPVFLSIGYSTCHWCHVMEHEAFEDPEVAAVFNRYFVCIKVDREERPDIDDHYMAMSQYITGSGGWPLNIFMTPDKRPFFAATYLPRTPRMGMPGIIPLLERVAELWSTQRQQLEENSIATVRAVASQLKPNPGQMPDKDMHMAAFRHLAEMYDNQWGGFGSAPKFPMPLYHMFLLRNRQGRGDAASLEMVEHSLRLMRMGGIYDQLGFGFHRYSVDRKWLVPHFEKMLYDQALMAIVYLQAFQSTGISWYRQVAEEIFIYVADEMTAPEGGFYSGQDADSEGEEGRCYLWTRDEIGAVIGNAEADLFCRLHGVSEAGNFEGSNILHLPVSMEEFATREGILPELLRADMERCRLALMARRRKRVSPFRDEKIITAWNGLMIAALSIGHAVTCEKSYLDAASKVAEFVASSLTRSDGRLLRCYHQGEAAVPAFLEDYAFLVWGMIELHQATLDPGYLDRACSLTREMLRLFDGPDSEGLLETAHDSERLPVQQQSAHDGVIPSGNSVAAFNLFRLGRITCDERFLRAGESIVRSFMGGVSAQPLASIHLLAAADYHLGPELTITLVGKREDLEELLQVVHRRFLPQLALRHGDDGDYPAVGKMPTAYVCAGGACRPPVTGAAELGDLIDNLLKKGG